MSNNIWELLEDKSVGVIDAKKLCNSGTGYFYPVIENDEDNEKNFKEVTLVLCGWHKFGYIIPVKIVYESGETKETKIMFHLRELNNREAYPPTCYCGPKEILYDCVINDEYDKKKIFNVLEKLLKGEKYVFEEKIGFLKKPLYGAGYIEM
jgi:hypothetical protein